MVKRALKWLVGALGLVMFFWLFILKIVSRVVDRLGLGGPCPASLGWLVDNPVRLWYMKPVLDWVGIQIGERVLELGSGPGVFTLEAARRAGPGGQIVAIDIQPEMIARVEKRVQAAGINNVETYVADAYHLPLDDASINRAFLVSVLSEIPDPARALQELKRVLRPDGVLSITAEFADPDYRFVPETVRMVVECGFTLTGCHGNWWRYTLNFRKEPVGATRSGYSLFQQQRMLGQFNQAVKRVAPRLSETYGHAFTRAVSASSTHAFALLVPQIPYIGGSKNPLTRNLVLSAMTLAFARGLQAQGMDDPEKIGRFIWDIGEAWYDAYPSWLLRLRGRYGFTPLAQWRWWTRVQAQEELSYPGNWSTTYISGNGHDFGVDYTECGVCKFFETQGATELVPYICRSDFIMSDRMGLGLERTTTLAEGGDRCDFRFKRGRPTMLPDQAG